MNHYFISIIYPILLNKKITLFIINHISLHFLFLFYIFINNVNLFYKYFNQFNKYLNQNLLYFIIIILFFIFHNIFKKIMINKKKINKIFYFN